MHHPRLKLLNATTQMLTKPSTIQAFPWQNGWRLSSHEQALGQDKSRMGQWLLVENPQLEQKAMTQVGKKKRHTTGTST